MSRPETAHYTHGAIECIDAIEAALGPREFAGFLRGSVMKYVWRMRHKESAVADARKASVYGEWLAEHEAKEMLPVDTFEMPDGSVLRIYQNETQIPPDERPKAVRSVEGGAWVVRLETGGPAQQQTR